MANPDRATLLVSGQIRPAPDGLDVTVRLARRSDAVTVWNWNFHVSNDEGRPAPGSGPDDKRSRMQGNVADRIAQGVQGYLNLSGTAPIKR